MSSQSKSWPFSKRLNPLILCLLVGFLPGSAQQNTAPASPKRPQVMDSYGKLPLSFEANQGQTDRRVKFLSRGSGYSLFLTQDSAVLSLHGKKQNAALRMKLVGANAHAGVAGAEALPGKSNYFIGNDPKLWRTNVPTYAAVKYSGVYPGVDLVYHGNQRLLEYDFVVAPGADPRAIDLRFQGARKLTVNRDGALVIGMGGDEVIEHAPVVYQEIAGARQMVACGYVLRGKNRVGFAVAAYDRTEALVIDPALSYSTFLNGVGVLGFPPAFAVAVDGAGNAYITGPGGYDFPTTLNAFQSVYGGGNANVFVTKLNAAGTALVYSTYLGGGGYDYGVGIAADANGNAYVTGAASTDFPTTPGAFQTTGPGAFVTKLNATGSSLIYSTYLTGGSAASLTVDISGDAYVTGLAGPSFPVTPGAFQTVYGSPANVSRTAFVTKLNSTGTGLVYSSYLNGATASNGIAVDSSGNAYVTGVGVARFGFPTTLGAFQTTATSSAVFILKLNATGSALIYSTLLGENDYGQAIAVDNYGRAYVTGATGYPAWLQPYSFPTTEGVLQYNFAGGVPWGDAFVTKINESGSALIYSTYLGGSQDDYGAGIALDASGNAYITGWTDSTDFPTTSGAFQTSPNCSAGCAFVSKLDALGSTLLYSTYLAGSGGSEAGGIAIDIAGNAYVTGLADSSDFPTSPNAFQTSFGFASAMGFVAKLTFEPISVRPVTTATLIGREGNDNWYLGAVTVDLTATETAGHVSGTYYSVDEAAYLVYGVPFQIPGDGMHELLFYSVDSAGNQELPDLQRPRIDSTAPVSRVATLASPAASPNFSVQWSGRDPVPPANVSSGLANYSIYYSDNGGPFQLWLSQTTATQAWFAGYLTHTYKFYSEAQDVAGNVEVKTTADTFTYVPQMPGDVSGDGQINCLDIAAVKASFGKKTGQPGFNPLADVNNDGVVNVLDLALVSQKLIPGTKCP